MTNREKFKEIFGFEPELPTGDYHIMPCPHPEYTQADCENKCKWNDDGFCERNKWLDAPYKRGDGVDTFTETV